MNKTELRQARMNHLAALFGAHKGEKVGSSCSGKWAGTSDYSVKFDNGYQFYISNGMKYFDEELEDKVNIYEGFYSRRNDIVSILREMETEDNKVAAEKGLKSYHVVDADFIRKSDLFQGWFYAVIEVDGERTTIQETGLHCSIRNYCSDGNKNHLLSETSSKYFVAGGVEKPDFVFHNVGFSIGSYSVKEEL